MKQEFPIKDELKIFPGFFGVKNRAANRREVKRKGIKKTMWFRKVKYFGFWMFYYETKFWKEIWNNIVTTKEKRVRKWKRFALSDKETIIYKE